MGTRRAYRLGKRSERTEESRQRVLDAAIELFRASGFHNVSFADLARQSGVGRTTMFELFKSKIGLLRAVETEVSRRAGVQELLVALSVDDAVEALKAAFRRGALVWGAERELFRKLFGYSAVDAELRAVMSEKEAGRRHLCGMLASQLKRQNALRTGMSQGSAARLLWLLTSFHAYDALANDDPPRRTGEIQWRIASEILLRAS